MDSTILEKYNIDADLEIEELFELTKQNMEVTKNEISRIKSISVDKLPNQVYNNASEVKSRILRPVTDEERGLVYVLNKRIVLLTLLLEKLNENTNHDLMKLEKWKEFVLSNDKLDDYIAAHPNEHISSTKVFDSTNKPIEIKLKAIDYIRYNADAGSDKAYNVFSIDAREIINGTTDKGFVIFNTGNKPLIRIIKPDGSIAYYYIPIEELNLDAGQTLDDAWQDKMKNSRTVNDLINLSIVNLNDEITAKIKNIEKILSGKVDVGCVNDESNRSPSTSIEHNSGQIKLKAVSYNHGDSDDDYVGKVIISDNLILLSVEDSKNNKKEFKLDNAGLSFNGYHLYDSSNRNIPSGIAGLDSNSLIPASILREMIFNGKSIYGRDITEDVRSFVQTIVNSILDMQNITEALDTLHELAAALNNDPNLFETLKSLINSCLRANGTHYSIKENENKELEITFYDSNNLGTKIKMSLDKVLIEYTSSTITNKIELSNQGIKFNNNEILDSTKAYNKKYVDDAFTEKDKQIEDLQRQINLLKSFVKTIGVISGKKLIFSNNDSRIAIASKKMIINTEQAVISGKKLVIGV